MPPKINNDQPLKETHIEKKDVDKIINHILTLYKTGKMYTNIGYQEDAENYFNQAVEYAYKQPDNLLSNPEFKEFREDLINKIYLYETTLLANENPDENNENDGDVKDRILSEENVRLTGQEEKKEKKIIEASKVSYSFPVVINEKVLAFIKNYSTKNKPVIKASLERSGAYIERYKEIFREQGVPEDLAYLPIIESGYKIHAFSRARAKGIWQFMKGTARLEGLKVDWWVDERCDPEKSAIAAAKHLKKLYQHYNDWYLALAAYNAGQGKIDRAIRRAKTRDFWKIAKHRWLLRRETKNYVPAFIAALIIAKNPEKYGFTDLNYKKPLEYDTVTIDSCTDLRVIARLCNTSVKNIQKLNPSLKRLTTPVSIKHFSINIPWGKKEEFLAKFKKLPPDKRVTLIYHKIKRGETLSQIARKYKTTVTAICRANGIRNRRLIRAGRVIVIPIGRGNYYPPAKPPATWKKIYYRVRRGDSLFKIAKKFNVSVASIKKWNHLKTNFLKPGQRLVIYLKFSPKNPNNNNNNNNHFKRGKKIRYKVRGGDSLFKIAQKYKTDVASIKKWNHLKTNFLKPGQTLVIYYNTSIKKKKHHSSRKRKKRKIPKGFYSVKRGDSLSSIAKKFKISVKKLKRMNKIRSNIIRPGDLLKVRNF